MGPLPQGARDGVPGRNGTARRWPWVASGLLGVALAVVGAGVALDQRQVAAEWRDRSTELASLVEARADDERELREQRDEAVALLEVSERDVRELEARLLLLADEKARAEDDATTVQVERDVISEVAATIVTATDALEACVEQLFALQTASVDAFNRSLVGEAVDVAPLNERAETVTANCTEARNAAARASVTADRVLAP